MASAASAGGAKLGSGHVEVARSTDPAGLARVLIREIIKLCKPGWSECIWPRDPEASLQGIYHRDRKTELLFETPVCF